MFCAKNTTKFCCIFYLIRYLLFLIYSVTVVLNIFIFFI